MTFEAGNKVRYSSDGRIGEITGKYREHGDAWQVCFDGVDLLFHQLRRSVMFLLTEVSH